MKMPAVAMTDTNNMFAALEFSSAASGSGVQPIVGVTLFVKSGFEEMQGKRRKRMQRIQRIRTQMCSIAPWDAKER